MPLIFLHVQDQFKNIKTHEMLSSSRWKKALFLNKQYPYHSERERVSVASKFYLLLVLFWLLATYFEKFPTLL